MTIATILAQLRAALAAELTPPTWRQEDDRPNDFYAGVGWRHWSSAPVQLRAGVHRWYTHQHDGSVTLTIGSYRPRSGTTMPEREYTLARNFTLLPDWQATLAKAVALAKKRAAIVTEDNAAKIAADEARERHDAALKAALTAADLPADAYQEELDYDDQRRLRTVNPTLRDGELRLTLDARATVNAQQAARLFEILPTLDVRVSATLTAEQWLAVRDIFEGG